VSAGAHEAEQQLHSPSHDGSVLLDIGAGVGALVVYTPDDLAGRELFVEGVHGAAPLHAHTLVRPRDLPAGRVFAAVFAALPAGRYRLSGAAPRADREAVVTGGRVCELDWRTRPRGEGRPVAVVDSGAR
jgi:hypothetical protein